MERVIISPIRGHLIGDKMTIGTTIGMVLIINIGRDPLCIHRVTTNTDREPPYKHKALTNRLHLITMGEETMQTNDIMSPHKTGSSHFEMRKLWIVLDWTIEDLEIIPQ